MNLVWDHWHIEPSSICTLRCPRCPRAEVPESLLNRQLDLDFFKTQIGDDTARQIKKITFCGNDGDPIYCRDLVEICIWFKTLNPTISLVIITNGSYKPVHWWQYLAKVLTKHDEVHWSIDGIDQLTNQQYRVNSDWHSIMDGIRAFRDVNKQTYTVWASIAFRFNQDHIDQQKALAQDLRFDLHQLTKSTKFGSKYPTAYGTEDPLEPTDTSLIASGHRFERVLSNLSQRPRPGQQLKVQFQHRAELLQQSNTHAGLCLIGNKGVFLNSQGQFYPCCWTANRYAHNSSWHELAATQFDLKSKTFADVINNEFWNTDFLQFDSIECQTKCTMEKLSDLEHTTEW